ncbi:MAG: hypothetical protein IH614_18085 [Desulfuromonadales bacterium]|nr:hypothetical protein [Desulfuromonadales bacterium]
MKTDSKGRREGPARPAPVRRGCSAAGGAGHRTDIETAPAQGRAEVEDLPGGVGANLRVDENGNAVDLVRIVLRIWLIQSQAQFGPPSAKTMEDNA